MWIATHKYIIFTTLPLGYPPLNDCCLIKTLLRKTQWEKPKLRKKSTTFFRNYGGCAQCCLVKTLIREKPCGKKL